MDMLKLENGSGIYKGEGFPIYTMMIMELSNIYIKNDRVLKNRDNKAFDYGAEIKNCNNITVEDDNYIDIFCTKDLEDRYNEVIKQLKIMYGDFIEKYIVIHCK